MAGGKSAAPLSMEAEAALAAEEREFASYRRSWESYWGRFCGSFKDTTSVCSTQFTPLTPGRIPRDDIVAAPTLQIFSMKLSEIKGGLEWPLSVYGVIAARDYVDNNRNLLFSCARTQSQEIHQDDTFLRLIGPSRAIVFTGVVEFEVQLRVKGSARSRDRQVVSVEAEGRLDVFIEAYGPTSGDITARGHVAFVPKCCNISQARCDLGDTEVEITVAWSLPVTDKDDIAVEGWVPDEER